jgi:serine/threonine-protein kinase
MMLAAGSTTQNELAATGLDSPIGVAVNSAGNLYVADYYTGRVVMLALAQGSTTHTEVTFNGLGGPSAVVAHHFR